MPSKKLNKTSYSLKTTAKLVRFPGGEKKFAKWLRDRSFLLKGNEPFQKYLDAKWFELVSRTIHKANPPFSVPVSRITLKGVYKLEKLVFDEYHKCKC
jgi:phage antirepressor YoqD-like protein